MRRIYREFSPAGTRHVMLVSLLIALVAIMPVFAAVSGKGRTATTTPANASVAAPALISAAAGEVTRLDLPGYSALDLVTLRATSLPSGNVAWNGYPRQWGPEYRADLVITAVGAIGDIRTPVGRYRLELSASGAQLVTLFSSAILSGDQCAPPVTPPASTALADAGTAVPGALDAQLTAAMARSDNAKIDVMFVYTPGVAAKFGTNLQAALDSVVLAANTAVAQSGVAVNFALAGTMAISPRSLVAGDLQSTLLAVTSSEDSALPQNSDFVGVAAKRHALGADVVVLLVTRADYSVGCAGSNCMTGAAWQASRESLSADRPGKHAYAVVDVAATDLSLTVTHEIGHLLGAGHDAASGGEGLFADSRGYRAADGVHGDLMSYALQPSMVFSSPLTLCNGEACGAAANSAAPADNARALNAARFLVAAFENSAPPPSPEIAGQWWDGKDGGRQIHLAHTGNGYTVLWLDRGSDGSAQWYVATGCKFTAGKCSADLYVSWTYQTGVAAGAVLDPSQVYAAKAGSVQIDAGDTGSLVATITLHSNSVSTTLSRQFPAVGAAAKNGIWWLSSGLESGLTVAQHDTSLFVSWLTYGNDGRSDWYVMPDCQLDTRSTSCNGDLFHAAGLPVAADATPLQKTGMAGLTFGSDYAGRFHWQAGTGGGYAEIVRDLPAQ